MSFPPPATTPDGASANPPVPREPSQLDQNQPLSLPERDEQPPNPSRSDFEEAQTIATAAAATAAAAAAAAAAVAATHGLEALIDDDGPASAPAPAPAPGLSPVRQYVVAPEPSYPPSNVPPIAASPTNSAHAANPKATRLRRACDMCSRRKVKCDETQPCRPCRDLNVECSFNREMKRRGPPNKHAEAVKAAKRPRLEPNLSPGPHNAAETLVSFVAAQAAPVALDGEYIAPWPVLTLLVDDFFTYIHPLTPFPHEPTFRQSFQNREDRTNREFLALLASMIGCLVASFPRSARLHLKAQRSMTLFPKATTMIEKCRDIALEARGWAFYAKDDVTVYDAATSYFLGLAAGYTMQWKLCRRFMTEAMSFIRELGYHKPRDLGSSMFGVTYRGPPFDHVQDQLGRRIFWCMFLGIRSMVQLGAPQSEIVLPPPTPTEPYPELPVEVDDRYILPTQILGQPDGVVSLLAGFNQAVKIYMTMNSIVSVELSYGITTLPFHDQRGMLEDSLQAVKQVMAVLPRELSLDLHRGPSNGQPSHGLGDFSMSDPHSVLGDDQFQYYPPAYPAHQPPTDIRHIIKSHPQRYRHLQYEIQKANIYVSQLATRSYYVERYLNLRDAHRESMRVQTLQSFAPEDGVGGGSKSVAAAALQAAAEQSDSIDESMTAERERIVQDLVTVLGSISQRNMEPNGGSLINKIRQVASTLVNDAPERKGPLAVKAEELLSRFVEILMRLERTGAGSGGTLAGSGIPGDANMSPQDEEQELRSWADLRDHQIRFYRNGGFIHQI